MASQNSVTNILEVTRVSPPANSTTEFTLPLTFFDTFLFKFPPTQRIFFYSLPDSTRSFFSSVILPSLKRSLSIALSHYLPLAGNLTWPLLDPKPMSIYSLNDAVSLTVAESNADLARLSGRGIKYVTELHPLVPELDSSDDRAKVISLQITLFPDQGFCVGITAHHLLLDGKSMTSFMKAWAHICREGDIKEPAELLPSFDRTLVKDPNRMDMLYLNQWMDFVTPGQDDLGRRSMKLSQKVKDFSPDQVRKTFELSKEDIQLLKDKVSSEKRHRPSTFVVTFAYMMTCMIRASRESGVVEFAFPADCRARLDPPLSANYFGNCIIAVIGESAPAKDFMEEKGFQLAVEKVSDVIERLHSDPLADMDKQLLTFLGFIKGEATRSISTSGSPRFGVYGVDFGWGRPELVEILSVDRGGLIGLAESRDESGAVEVAVAMKKHDMQRLVQLFADGLRR